MVETAFTVVKTCGTCAYRKRPVCLSLRFVHACNKISQSSDDINVNALATLIKETEALRHRKYKCAREPKVWTHLTDNACAFWQPALEDGVLSCFDT